MQGGILGVYPSGAGTGPGGGKARGKGEEEVWGGRKERDERERRGETGETGERERERERKMEREREREPHLGAFLSLRQACKVWRWGFIWSISPLAASGV